MTVISAMDAWCKPDGRQAIAARKWFAEHGPADLQPLPLGYDERERLKAGGAPHILAWYARSLAGEKYDFQAHPSFHDYARGVMASQYAPDFIKNDGKLLTRFPPCPLRGLGPGLSWERPKRPRGRPRRQNAGHDPRNAPHVIVH